MVRSATSLFVLITVAGVVLPQGVVYGPNLFAKGICKKSPLGLKTCLRRAEICRDALSPPTLGQFREAAERCTQVIGAILPQVGESFLLQPDNSTVKLVQRILDDPNLWADYMACIVSTNHGWETEDAMDTKDKMRAWLEASVGVKIGSVEHDLLQDMIAAIQECSEETESALTTCMVRACVKV